MVGGDGGECRDDLRPEVSGDAWIKVSATDPAVGGLQRLGYGPDRRDVRGLPRPAAVAMGASGSDGAARERRRGANPRSRASGTSSTAHKASRVCLAGHV